MVSLARSLASLGADRKRIGRRTGITQSRVDEIFAGADITAVELRLISEALKLAPDALLHADVSSRRSDVRFRKTPRKRAPFAAEIRIEQLAKFLSRNNLLIPAKHWRVDATLSSRRSIEDASWHIRSLVCGPGEMLSPLTDLSERMDHAGIASTIVMNDLGVEGACTSVDGSALVVVAGRTFAPRMLFTCAHELAHIVLGHVTGGQWLIDESTIEAFDADNDQERISNTLASAVLLPADGVAKFLTHARKLFGIGDDDLSATEILLLSRYFGTSFYVAAMRLEHLGIAPVGSAASFEEAIRSDHVSAEAYAKELGLPPRTPIEVPTISLSLKRNISNAVESGRVSLGRVGDILGYSLIEVSNAIS